LPRHPANSKKCDLIQEPNRNFQIILSIGSLLWLGREPFQPTPSGKLGGVSFEVVMVQIWIKSSELGIEAARLMWLQSMLLVSTGAKAQTEACLAGVDKLEAAWLASLRMIGNPGSEHQR
jgi:hypothetical protein